MEKGEAAVKEVMEYAGADANVELLQIDVGSDESVQKAATALKEKDVKLTAIVNNAGTGIAHGVSDEMILNVNTLGPKRVVDALQSFLDPAGSKIINVGSGAGPMYVRNQPKERIEKFVSDNWTWDEIKAEVDKGCPEGDPSHGMAGMGAYGLSKALLACYTMVLAKELKEKNVCVYCLTPGFIATNITKGFTGSKPVEEGTVSLRHCLFEAKPEESGWFFGSDAKRSPMHFLRNPGDPVFDGKVNL
jgi:NAD(P)-dependent dehydrogenase (short-subunit alcohol dehydrogenase family)